MGFNQRSAHTERHQRTETFSKAKGVSIHAPPIRSDFSGAQKSAPRGGCNPRSAHTERLWSAGLRCRLPGFKPRSAPTERRYSREIWSSDSRGFNPRSAHTERQEGGRKCLNHMMFQSTLRPYGATSFWSSGHLFCFCFNPRSAHTERLIFRV